MARATARHILVASEDKCNELKAAIEGGAEALANYFSEKWSRIEAFARTGRFDAVDDDGEILSESDLMASAYARPVLDHDEVADQDWMELAWLMRYECPDLFTEMLLVLRAKVRAFESGRPEFEDDEDEEDEDKAEDAEEAVQLSSSSS